MPKTRKKRRSVRIETELSQPGVKMTRDARHHHELRTLKNRIAELEKALGLVSRGGNGVAMVIFISPQAAVALDHLANSGFWGWSSADAARELMMIALRQERHL